MLGKKVLAKLLNKPISQMLYITYLFYMENNIDKAIKEEKESQNLTFEEYSKLILERMKAQ